jgi:hypothetical protein
LFNVRFYPASTISGGQEQAIMANPLTGEATYSKKKAHRILVHRCLILYPENVEFTQLPAC